MGQFISTNNGFDHEKYAGCWYELARVSLKSEFSIVDAMIDDKYTWDAKTRQWRMITKINDHVHITSGISTVNDRHFILFPNTYQSLDDYIVYDTNYTSYSIVHNINSSLLRVLVRGRDVKSGDFERLIALVKQHYLERSTKGIELQVNKGFYIIDGEASDGVQTTHHHTIILSA